MGRQPGKLPKISIVTPTLNQADFLEGTIRSVVGQDYPNLEYIIQDGGSTDGSLNIIKRFAQLYPEVIKWESKKDKGQVDAINKGLKKATGSVLAYLNGDDLYQVGALARVGEYFASYPDTLWLTGRGDVIDEKGKKIYAWVTAYKNLLLKLNFYPFLLAVNYITQPATFLSRRAYLNYGPFTGTKNYVMEYGLWLRLGKIKMPAVIDDYLASFRLTPENISATSFKDLLSLDYQIARKYTNNPVILFCHLVNNLGRVGVVSVMKAK